MILTLPVCRLLQWRQRENDIDVLAMEVRHVTEHAALARHHRDPFDPTLAARARIEGLTILSGDAVVSMYDAAVRW